MEFFIFTAGVFQIALVLGSLVIPKLLNWKKELSNVSVLTRQVFWTYAGYILMTNLCFGLLSACAPGILIDGSLLASAVSLFIGLYWTTRIAVQFFYFDRKSAPQGYVYVLGEMVLTGLFLFLASVYMYAFYINYFQQP